MNPVDIAARHHTEKAVMIHRLLAGKKGLSVFEPCAFKAGRKYLPGECSKAYSQYAAPGEHLRICYQSLRPETDWVYQVHLQSVAGRKFDVVDLDGYGGPEKPLLAGAVALVKNGGLLFCTFPLRGGHHRFPHARKVIDAVYLLKLPSVTDYLGLVVRAALLYDVRAELRDLAVYEGKALRAAFHCAKLTSVRARMQEIEAARDNLRRLTGTA